MTQFSLKMLAMAAMLLDHLGKVVLSDGILIPILGIQGDLVIRTICQCVGRMAFPIFAWFAAEGCRKTKDPTMYLLRLLGFAVLSEVPFQLCFYYAGIYGIELACHNVLFTISLAVAAVIAGNKLEQMRIPAVAAKLIPAVIAIALGWILHTDYNAWGVALILALYYLPEEKQQLMFLMAWSTVFMLAWHGWNGSTFIWLTRQSVYGLLLQWIGQMFAIPFLATYSGKRGRKAKLLFYVFYPAHLSILYLIHLFH